MSSDATRLYVYLEHAMYYNEDLRHEVDQDEVDFIKELFKEYELGVSGESYDSTIISSVFTDERDNIQIVDKVEEDIRNKFQERQIDRYKDHSDQAPSSEGLPYVIGIHVQRTEEEQREQSDKQKKRMEEMDTPDWSDDEKETGDVPNIDTEFESYDNKRGATENVEWRDKSDFTREQDVREKDSSKFHPPCEHCGSTVFKQEITTTHYVECDKNGNFVDQDTEHERNEVIYCDECGQKLSERSKY